VCKRSNVNRFRLSRVDILDLEEAKREAEAYGDIKLYKRVRALLLVGRDGKSRNEAAEIVECDRRSIFGWQQRFDERGVDGLRRKSGSGRKRRLTDAQLTGLASHILLGPQVAGFEAGAWTSTIVADLIRRIYGIKYSPAQVRRILNDLDFSHQLPRVKLAKADADAQQEWLTETLPDVFRRVQQEGGVIYYEDEATFRLSGSVTRTWARVGEGTEVKSQPGRESAKVFGAVSAEADPRWSFLFAEKFNGKTFLRFLKQLIGRNVGRKVFLVLDNVRYHKAKLVQEWVKANADKIQLVFLPAYSPEFNAVEYVWRLTRRMATHNVHFEKMADLRTKLFRRFNRFQGNPAPLRSTMKSFLAPAA